VPRKVFVAGEILTAADVNTNLMDQAVMVFDDAAARTAAIPSPVEGMVTYLKDTDALTKFNGSAFVPVGTILQVVSTTLTTTYSESVSGSTISGVIPGLTATITPSSTSSKILVIGYVTSSQGIDGATSLQLVEGTTPIGTGAAAGGRPILNGRTFLLSNDAFSTSTVSVNFLHSPATTSSLTYGFRLHNWRTNTQTIFVNRTSSDADEVRGGRSSSTITVMEVAG